MHPLKTLDKVTTTLAAKALMRLAIIKENRHLRVIQATLRKLDSQTTPMTPTEIDRMTSRLREAQMGLMEVAQARKVAVRAMTRVGTL